MLMLIKLEIIMKKAKKLNINKYLKIVIINNFNFIQMLIKFAFNRKKWYL